MAELKQEIDAYYGAGKEAGRLANLWGELEKVRSQSILRRFLPAAPACVCDVGGGAGVYAFPLAEQGYEVHLVDPMELHIGQARERAEKSGVALASMGVGDARRLETASKTADAVLLLGPLYHLVERAERMQALDEARRILKPGGVVFAAGISRFASLLDGLSRGFLRDREFRKIVSADLATGQHRNHTENFEYFTTAYFHRPEELAEEIGAAGFEGVQVLGVEGPAWTSALFPEIWRDAERREELLEYLRVIESEASIVGTSGHLMGVARRGG